MAAAPEPWRRELRELRSVQEAGHIPRRVAYSRHRRQRRTPGNTGNTGNPQLAGRRIGEGGATPWIFSILGDMTGVFTIGGAFACIVQVRCGVFCPKKMLRSNIRLKAMASHFSSLFCSKFLTNMGVSINFRYPNSWMVFVNGKSHRSKWMMTGGSPS